jgi:hypothetical protein
MPEKSTVFSKNCHFISLNRLLSITITKDFLFYINKKVFSDLSEEALEEKKELVLNDVMRL